MPSDIDQRSLVLGATDIVQIIGQSVALKKRGARYVGLCPFHSEKSPSFTVDSVKQYFHCFGCKAGGNAIDFVIKRDRIEFLDALRLLAEKAGIELARQGVTKQKASDRQLLFDAMSSACTFFEKCLADRATGTIAQSYLTQRGLSAESIRQFQLGLAPDRWDGLASSPLLKKFPPGVLASAGLIKSRESGGYYDTFRNRLIFPIRDESGRVIAFGGRAMPGSEDPAKYLNSPETPLFSKGRCVFGLDVARHKIALTRTAVVVEGYTDVLMAHQFGVGNVVSVLGTSLAEQQVSVLRRFADRIVLLFDADVAGNKAADRAIDLFLTQPIDMAIAQMPAGMDPDEYLLKNGAAAFESLIANATDVLGYKWSELTRAYGENGMTGQQKAVSEYMELLASARESGPVDSMRWGAVLARVSRLTQIPVEQLHQRFKGKRPVNRRFVAHADASNLPTEKVRRDPGTSGTPGRKLMGSLDAGERAQRWILGILLAEPRQWQKVQASIGPEDFTDPLHQELASIYWQRQRDEGEPVFNEFLGLLPRAELVEAAVELLDESAALPDHTTALRDAIMHVSQVSRQRVEQRKLVARLGRKGVEHDGDRSHGEKPDDRDLAGIGHDREGRENGQSAASESEVALLRQLQDLARQPDVAGRL